jgi:hypothetical protein
MNTSTLVGCGVDRFGEVDTDPGDVGAPVLGDDVADEVGDEVVDEVVDEVADPHPASTTVAATSAVIVLLVMWPRSSSVPPD